MLYSWNIKPPTMPDYALFKPGERCLDAKRSHSYYNHDIYNGQVQSFQAKRITSERKTCVPMMTMGRLLGKRGTKTLNSNGQILLTL